MGNLNLAHVVKRRQTGTYTLIRRTAGAYDPVQGTFDDPGETTSTIGAVVVPNANIADDEIPTERGKLSTDRILVVVAMDQLGGVALTCTDDGILSDRLVYQGKSLECINTLDYGQAGGFCVAQFGAFSPQTEGSA